MRTLEQQTVAAVSARVPGIAKTLREYRIDPTSHMRLAHAAAAASTTPDEIFAVAEMRLRRAAHVRPAEAIEFEHEYEHELAFA